MISTKCVICDATIATVQDKLLGRRKHGHNAHPVADGRCCDDCHMVIVIPTRLFQIKKLRRDS